MIWNSTNPSAATVYLVNTEEANTHVCDNQANKIIKLNAVEEISQSGESGFWIT